MKKNKIILICLLVFFSFSVNVLATEKIAWFKSGAQSRFWPVVENIMQAAAKDLQMDLSIYEFNNDPIYMVTLVREILSDPGTRPDCVLIHNFKNRGEKIIKIAEEFTVPIFIFNAGFGAAAAADLGNPREKYPHWIGMMVPDDEYAGYLLAQELIEQAKTMDKDSSKPVQMVALEGNRTSEASNRRVSGLKRALQEHPEVINNQFFHSKWKVELASEAFRATQRRYPGTTMFWTASESMSIGVVEGAKELGLVAGKDFITGGVDLLPENKEYLENGDIAVSVGGHYFEGAWALVLIHDYLNGVDFAAGETTSFTTKMTAQTKEDLTKFNDIYSVLSKSNLESLNFKQLSKFYNPKVKKYNFDIEDFLKSSRN